VKGARRPVDGVAAWTWERKSLFSLSHFEDSFSRSHATQSEETGKVVTVSLDDWCLEAVKGRRISIAVVDGDWEVDTPFCLLGATPNACHVEGFSQLPLCEFVSSISCLLGELQGQLVSDQVGPSAWVNQDADLAAG